MSAVQREEYARYRVQKLGARQAIDAENDKLESDSYKRAIPIGASFIAFGAGAGTFNVPLVAAGFGSYAVTSVLAGWRNTKQTKYASRNIDAIKRVSDIPDYTTGERYNTRT